MNCYPAPPAGVSLERYSPQCQKEKQSNATFQNNHFFLHIWCNVLIRGFRETWIILLNILTS